MSKPCEHNYPRFWCVSQKHRDPLDPGRTVVGEFDGSEIRLTHQLRLVVYPIVYKVLAPSKRWLLGISSFNRRICFVKCYAGVFLLILYWRSPKKNNDVVKNNQCPVLVEKTKIFQFKGCPPKNHGIKPVPRKVSTESKKTKNNNTTANLSIFTNMFVYFNAIDES